MRRYGETRQVRRLGGQIGGCREGGQVRILNRMEIPEGQLSSRGGPGVEMQHVGMPCSPYRNMFESMYQTPRCSRACKAIYRMSSNLREITMPCRITPSTNGCEMALQSWVLNQAAMQYFEVLEKQRNQASRSQGTTMFWHEWCLRFRFLTRAVTAIRDECQPPLFTCVRSHICWEAMVAVACPPASAGQLASAPPSSLPDGHMEATKLCSCARDCLTAAAARGVDSAAWKLRRSSNCGAFRWMAAASRSWAAIASSAFASACRQEGMSAGKQCRKGRSKLSFMAS